MAHHPTSTRAGGVALAGIALALACGHRAPAGLDQAADGQHDAIAAVAEAAATACPAVKSAVPLPPDGSAKPLPPSPAVGSPLESDARVTNVFVSCMWPDLSSPEIHAGGDLPALRGGLRPVPVRAATMAEEMSVNTCRKDAKACEQWVVPSRFSKSPDSLDVRLKRPLPDGGEVEVTVVFEEAGP